MATNSLSTVAAALRNADSILITTHVHPDGDAVGSLLATAELVRQLGKHPVCAMADPVPRGYQWLPGASEVLTPEACSDRYDLMILVDVAQRDRIGAMASIMPSCAHISVLDHHADVNPDGPLWFIDPTYAATGEIVADLFETCGVPLTEAAAVNAYVALTTDTGGFRYSNTNARAHRIAARLVEIGVDVAEISARVFDGMSAAKYALLARVLPRVSFLENGVLAIAELYQTDLAATGALDEDSDGIINFPRNVEGVELAVLLRETGAGATKISCRSRNRIDCAAFMAQFGGGGHRKAAGATVEWSVPEARRRIVERAAAALRGTP